MSGWLLENCLFNSVEIQTLKTWQLELQNAVIHGTTAGCHSEIMNWSEVCVRVVDASWDDIFANRTATHQNKSQIEFSAFTRIIATSILSAYIHEYVRCSGGKVIYPINGQEFTVSKIWVESKNGSVVNQGRFNIPYSEMRWASEPKHEC